MMVDVGLSGVEAKQIMLQTIFIQQEVELTHDNMRWHDRAQVLNDATDGFGPLNSKHKHRPSSAVAMSMYSPRSLLDSVVTIIYSWN